MNCYYSRRIVAYFTIREKGSKAKMKYVGVKQVIKAARENKVHTVYVGKDVETNVVSELISLCHQKDIQIHYVDSMKELGNMAKIEVKAAAAAE